MLELKNIKKIIETINLGSNFSFVFIKERNEYVSIFQIYPWVETNLYSVLEISGIYDFDEDENYFYFSTVSDGGYEGIEFSELRILKSDFFNVYDNIEKFRIDFQELIENRKLKEQKELELRNQEERNAVLKERTEFLISEKCSKMKEICEILHFTCGHDDDLKFWIQNNENKFIYYYPQFRPSVDKHSVEIIKKFIK